VIDGKEACMAQRIIAAGQAAKDCPAGCMI